VQPDRRTATSFGMLLVSGIAFGALSSVPALEYPDYLAILPGIRTQVLTAVFFQAAMATAWLSVWGIAGSALALAARLILGGFDPVPPREGQA